MSEAIAVVLVTVPDADTAKRLSTALVEQRLAACVNIIPQISSVYRWNGAVTEEAESLLVLKTRASLIAELQKEIIRLHPYDTPEVVALTPSAVAEKYLRWVNTETTSES